MIAHTQHVERWFVADELSLFIGTVLRYTTALVKIAKVPVCNLRTINKLPSLSNDMHIPRKITSCLLLQHRRPANRILLGNTRQLLQAVLPTTTEEHHKQALQLSEREEESAMSCHTGGSDFSTHTRRHNHPTLPRCLSPHTAVNSLPANASVHLHRYRYSSFPKRRNNNISLAPPLVSRTSNLCALPPYAISTPSVDGEKKSLPAVYPLLCNTLSVNVCEGTTHRHVSLAAARYIWRCLYCALSMARSVQKTSMRHILVMKTAASSSSTNLSSSRMV